MSKYILVLVETTKIFVFPIDKGDSLDCLDSAVSNLDDDGKDTSKVTGILLIEEKIGRKVDSERWGQAEVEGWHSMILNKILMK